MVLDPKVNKQNKQRIMNVWTPLVTKLRTPERLALFCLFKRADMLKTSASNKKDALLWQMMSAVPASIIDLIFTKAYLTDDQQQL